MSGRLQQPLQQVRSLRPAQQSLPAAELAELLHLVHRTAHLALSCQVAHGGDCYWHRLVGVLPERHGARVVTGYSDETVLQFRRQLSEEPSQSLVYFVQHLLLLCQVAVVAGLVHRFYMHEHERHPLDHELDRCLKLGLVVGVVVSCRPLDIHYPHPCVQSQSAHQLRGRNHCPLYPPSFLEGHQVSRLSCPPKQHHIRVRQSQGLPLKVDGVLLQQLSNKRGCLVDDIGSELLLKAGAQGLGFAEGQVVLEGVCARNEAAKVGPRNADAHPVLVCILHRHTVLGVFLEFAVVEPLNQRDAPLGELTVDSPFPDHARLVHKGKVALEADVLLSQSEACSHSFIGSPALVLSERVVTQQAHVRGVTAAGQTCLYRVEESVHSEFGQQVERRVPAPLEQ